MRNCFLLLTTGSNPEQNISVPRWSPRNFGYPVLVGKQTCTNLWVNWRLCSSCFAEEQKKKRPSREDEVVIIDDSSGDEFETPAKKVLRLPASARYHRCIDNQASQEENGGYIVTGNQSARHTSRRARQDCDSSVDIDEPQLDRTATDSHDEAEDLEDADIHSTTAQGPKWNCVQCTFLNHEDLPFCEMCSSARKKQEPSSARAPREIRRQFTFKRRENHCAMTRVTNTKHNSTVERTCSASKECAVDAESDSESQSHFCDLQTASKAACHSNASEESAQGPVHGSRRTLNFAELSTSDDPVGRQDHEDLSEECAESDDAEGTCFQSQENLVRENEKGSDGHKRRSNSEMTRTPKRREADIGEYHQKILFSTCVLCFNNISVWTACWCPCH